MPFTFSHPAIVLPFYRKPALFSLTGLIIGSMSPDFEYFLRMRIISNYSHTTMGIFLFDLPVALLAAFIFHNIIRNSLFKNLPIFLYQRFQPYIVFDWNKYAKNHRIIVIISTLTGIVSHLLWDNFTHPTGYFVEKLIILQQDITVNGINIPIYKLLQHGSSLAGIILIMLFIYKLPRSYDEKNEINVYYWLTIFIITSLILLCRVLLAPSLTQPGNLVVGLIMSGLIALVLAPLLMLRMKYQR